MTRAESIRSTKQRADLSGLVFGRDYVIDTYLIPEPRATRRRVDRYDTAEHNLHLAWSWVPKPRRVVD